MVSNEYSEAAVEVLGILNELDENDFKKIPKKIIEFLEGNKSNTYNPNIDYSADVNDINLKEKTKEILAGIYLDYLCPDDKKQDFMDNIRKNEAKYQEYASEVYNSNDIFKNKSKINNEELLQEKRYPVEVKKEKWYMKIISFIKGIFK